MYRVQKEMLTRIISDITEWIYSMCTILTVTAIVGCLLNLHKPFWRLIEAGCEHNTEK